MTAEHYQQKSSWTDRVPIPVLVIWLALVIGIVYAILLCFGSLDLSVTMGGIPSKTVGYGLRVGKGTWF